MVLSLSVPDKSDCASDVTVTIAITSEEESSEDGRSDNETQQNSCPQQDMRWREHVHTK